MEGSGEQHPRVLDTSYLTYDSQSVHGFDRTLNLVSSRREDMEDMDMQLGAEMNA